MDAGKPGPLSRVSQKGQTQIPVDVRKALDLDDGSMLSWTVEGPTTVKVTRVRIELEKA